MMKTINNFMKKAVALTAMALTLTLGVNAQTVDVNGAAIQNVGTPTSATDAAVNGDVLNNATNISNNTTDIATNTADIATINDSLGSVNDSINIIKTAVAALPTGDASWTDVTTLAGGWVDYSAAYNSVRYRKDANGYVHIQGMVKDGTAGSTAVFNLPAGYRPAKNMHFITAASNATGNCSVRVLASGNLNIQTAATWVDFGEIIYLAEN